MMNTRRLFVALFGALIYTSPFVSPAKAQQLPLNQLVLKGTHNSYACCGGESFFGWDNSCPVMHNPPNEQMDDWNVWALELDFSTEILNGIPTLIVGHDGPSGEDSFTTPDWGGTLRNYLIGIRDSRSFAYRPVFIFFNHKTWGDDNYDSSSNWGPLLSTLLTEVFGVGAIFGPSSFSANSSIWPTVPQMAAKVIPYTNQYMDALIFSGQPQGFNRWYKDDYTNASERASNATSGEYNIISPDQYQLDWTFDYVAPPNPIFVKGNVSPSFSIVNSYGHGCTNGLVPDVTNVNNPFEVGQHGTFRLPFNEVLESVNAAFPGWTLLIRTGAYPENITINKPLVLEVDGGPVIIGN